MEKEKGCSTAYLDSSPTIITAFTELGGAEPLVAVLKGCEELSCSQYSALNNSTYPNTILYGGIIVKPLKPDQGLDKLPTTQSVWLEHTCRHVSSSAQLHSSVQTRLFRLQEHLREHLLVDSTLLVPNMHRMS